MTTHGTLLADYITNGSEPAFAELVERYINLVYSTGLRLVEGDTHRAEDVTQTVFADLARLGGTLSKEVMLGGWLHRRTFHVAADLMRRERRRQHRERQAAEMNALNDHTEPRFEHIAPFLDEAINQLGGKDRAAIVLRFFEGRDLRSIGAALGSNEDAAQKRVARALEKLRDLLSRRGIKTSAAALSVVLSANAVQAAPVGLAVTVSTAVASGGAAIASTATEAIAMTALQKVVVGTALAVAVGTGIYQASETRSLRTQLQTVEQQQAPLAAQVAQLIVERDDAARSLPGLREALRTSTDNRDLLRLRAEAARLRSDIASARQSATVSSGTNDPVEAMVESWIAGLNRIKATVERTPEAVIPEFRLLGDADWWNAAKHMAAGMDERKVLSGMRFSARYEFQKLVQPALQKYVQTHDSQFPTDLAQLRPYFKSPVDDAVLLRWQIMPVSDFPELVARESDRQATHVITQRASPLDEADQTRWLIQPNALTHTSFKPNPRK